MPNLPMVIVTGYPSLPTALEAFRLATIDYLVKPVDIEQLKGAIVRAVEKRRLSRALEAAADYSSALTDTFHSIEPSAGGTGTADSRLTWTAEQCVARALTDIGRLSALAGRLLSALQGWSSSSPDTGSQTDACRLLQCPRRDAYDAAIRETLEVIQRTKQSFKSKELGALRIRLEALLKSQGDA
jgi:YesN/AraC family two-component response regulator